jgi:hypothetical protein
MQRTIGSCTSGGAAAVAGDSFRALARDWNARFSDYLSENFGALGQTKKTVYIDN